MDIIKLAISSFLHVLYIQYIFETKIRKDLSFLGQKNG